MTSFRHLGEADEPLAESSALDLVQMAGVQAEQEYKYERQNPHTVNSFEWWAWREGWRWARVLRKLKQRAWIRKAQRAVRLALKEIT